MPPGIRLEITVDDKGTPVVRQFNEEVQKTPAAAQKSEKSLASSAASALRYTVAIGGLYLGLQGLSQVLQAVGAAAIGFESGLANINTLGIRSHDVQRQLRSELLQLPPILGTSTTLATGLYEVLSSGIAPAKAVEFLGTAATLAKAGLGDLDTSTVALTKTMAAYNLPAEQAGRVSDILFKTVEIGQGSLQQFAGALPQVTQLAASMGVSLEDTANAMATLSQTFRNADTAATGFRSLLQQLLQNSDQFLALGINIRQVISEQGLLGAVKVLQQVSQGSSERLRTFVNDIEGFNAALALTGPQFRTLVENQQKFQEATGSVATAVRFQTATTAGAWQELVGTVDRGVQALAPAITSGLTSVLQATTAFASDFNTQILGIPKTIIVVKQNLDTIAPDFAKTVRELLTIPVSDRPPEKAVDELHAALVRLSPTARGAGASLGFFWDQTQRASAVLDAALRPYTEWRDESVRFAEAQGVAQQRLKVTNDQLAAMDAALKGVRSSQTLTTSQILIFAKTLEDSLRGAASSGLVSTETLKKGATDAVDAVIKKLGQLPPGLREIVTQIEAIGKAAPVGLGPVNRTIIDIDENGKKTIKTIMAFGEEGKRAFKSAEAAVPPVTQAIKEVDAQGKITLKTIQVFGPATEEAFAKRGKAAVNTFSEAVNASVTAVTRALIESGSQAGGFGRSLTEAQLKSAFELGLISRQARDTALALKQAGQEGGRGLGEGVKEGADQASGALESVVAKAQEIEKTLTGFRAFGETPRQLFEQLAEYRRQIANAPQIAFAAVGTDPGYYSYFKNLIDTANDAIYFITERLKDLGYNADGSRILTEAVAGATQELTTTTMALAGATQTLTTVGGQAATTQVQQAQANHMLSAATLMAAGATQVLIDRQRALLLLGTGSQITDRPGRGRPVSIGDLATEGALPLTPAGVQPGIPTLSESGLSLSDLGINPLIPTQPGRLDQLPVRIPAPPASPLLSPPGASVTAAPLSGGVVAPAVGTAPTAQPGAGGGRIIGGTLTGVSNLTPTVSTPTVQVPSVGTTRGDVIINVPTMALTRGGAQELADVLAPALRELQRRGLL